MSKQNIALFVGLSDGKTLGGTGRLTDKKIYTLQNYFGVALVLVNHVIMVDGNRFKSLATKTTQDEYDGNICIEHRVRTGA